MKISKSQLKQIIKEEIASLTEDRSLYHDQPNVLAGQLYRDMGWLDEPETLKALDQLIRYVLDREFTEKGFQRVLDQEADAWEAERQKQGMSETGSVREAKIERSEDYSRGYKDGSAGRKAKEKGEEYMNGHVAGREAWDTDSSRKKD
jgi:hypothetical protein